jgi:hypothetical protein
VDDLAAFGSLCARARGGDDISKANEDVEDRCHLTDDGAVSFVDMSITPWYHPEIDDVDKIIVEDPSKTLDNEVCTGRA